MSLEETLFVSLVILVLGNAVFWLQRYKRCPSDKILVVYGKPEKAWLLGAFIAEPPSFGRLSRILDGWI